MYWISKTNVLSCGNWEANKSNNEFKWPGCQERKGGRRTRGASPSDSWGQALQMVGPGRMLATSGWHLLSRHHLLWNNIFSLRDMFCTTVFFHNNIYFHNNIFGATHKYWASITCSSMASQVLLTVSGQGTGQGRCLNHCCRNLGVAKVAGQRHTLGRPSVASVRITGRGISIVHCCAPHPWALTPCKIMVPPYEWDFFLSTLVSCILL